MKPTQFVLNEDASGIFKNPNSFFEEDAHNRGEFGSLLQAQLFALDEYDIDVSGWLPAKSDGRTVFYFAYSPDGVRFEIDLKYGRAVFNVAADLMA